LPNRLFTFGCSFTQYKWPTWADILGCEFDYYENWGKPGAGNQYIYQSLIECHLKNNITSDDTVIIMWTSIDRDDRYLQGKWETHGSIFTINHPLYTENYSKKYYDSRGYFLRDLGFISGAKLILDNLNINYEFLSMVPIECSDSIDSHSAKNDDDILECFNSVLYAIKPSVIETIYNFQWGSNPNDLAFSIEHQYNLMAGASWPTFNNFLLDNYQGIHSNIIKEIHNSGLIALRNAPPDLHPEPKLHLKYLNQILPNYTISAGTIDWINNYKYGAVFNSHQPLNRL
jgi:hypothetical protein